MRPSGERGERGASHHAFMRCVRACLRACVFAIAPVPAFRASHGACKHCSSVHRTGEAEAVMQQHDDRTTTAAARRPHQSTMCRNELASPGSCSWLVLLAPRLRCRASGLRNDSLITVARPPVPPVPPVLSGHCGGPLGAAATEGVGGTLRHRRTYSMYARRGSRPQATEAHASACERDPAHRSRPAARSRDPQQRAAGVGLPDPARGAGLHGNACRDRLGQAGGTVRRATPSARGARRAAGAPGGRVRWAAERERRCNALLRECERSLGTDGRPPLPLRGSPRLSEARGLGGSDSKHACLSASECAAAARLSDEKTGNLTCRCGASGLGSSRRSGSEHAPGLLCACLVCAELVAPHAGRAHARGEGRGRARWRVGAHGRPRHATASRHRRTAGRKVPRPARRPGARSHDVPRDRTRAATLARRP